MSEEAGGSGITNKMETAKPDEVEAEGEEDDDQAVTMLDVLEEENDLEEDANAVLGGSDDQNCTYESGYIPRQALYACVTCVPVGAENFKPAGVCLACSYNCHEGHELVELYTKRNFKCDCGNSRFGDKKCSILPEKDPENEHNNYNQNFKGVYCVCHRPYPDPEDTVEDEMVQCIVCEDWLHGRHLDLPPSVKLTSHNFAEMICGTCMEKNAFLWHYAEEIAVSEENADVSVDISVDEGKSDAQAEPASKEMTNEKPEEATDIKTDDKTEKKVEAVKQEVAPKEEGSVKNGGETDNGASTDDVKAKEQDSTKPAEDVKSEDAAKTSSEDENSKVEETGAAKCHLASKENAVGKKLAALWPNGWRKKLCTCDDCKVMYKERGVEFLPDENDMVQTYEEQGKKKNATSGSQYEQGLRALSSLDRVRQLDAIEEYNKMQVQLKEFLSEFAAKKRVVKEEDIKGFFAQLQATKKRRTEENYFCH